MMNWKNPFTITRFILSTKVKQKSSQDLFGKHLERNYLQICRQLDMTAKIQMYSMFEYTIANIILNGHLVLHNNDLICTSKY